MNNEAKKGRPFLSFLLIAVMIAELATAAFKYPGFLVKTPGETDPYRPTGPTQGNAVNGSTQANTETPGEEEMGFRYGSRRLDRAGAASSG